MNPPARARTIPDFTFPPISRYATTCTTQLAPHSEAPISQPNVSRTPPNFGSKVFPTPAPTPPPITMAQIPPQTHLLSSSAPAATPSLLLSIPLEIRLQIYAYVLASSRIHHAHLAPLASEQPTSTNGMNTEEFHTVMLRPAYITTSKSLSNSPRFRKEERRCVVERFECGDVREWAIVKEGTGQRDMRGKMPTGLLASCKQIYDEAHRLPFETNTFTFVNWFWSGIYAARQFARILQPWQAESIRWVGIEVLGGDLWADRAVGGNRSKLRGVREWVELCGLWGNVRGIRVCIKGSVVVAKRKAGEQNESRNGDDVDGGGTESVERESSTIMEVTADWVIQGLLTLTSLRQLELEIEDEDVPRADKVAFCADLAVLLNSKAGRGRSNGEAKGSERWGGEVQVIFREEVEVLKEVVGNKDFTWYGGEPGDDMIWGDGS